MHRHALTLSFAAILASTVAAQNKADHAAHFRYDFHGVNSNDFFGNSVAIVGDMNKDGCDDFVIGATSAVSGAGAVTAFSGADGRILFTWPGTSPGDQFGRSVAPAGDVNRDGHPDVVIGAYGVDSNNLTNNGRVYVYSGKDYKLIHSWDGATAEWLGYSVHGAGDVNLDGHADIIAGAPRYSTTSAANVGRAYVFSGKDKKILKTLDATGGAANDQWGHSVCGGFDCNRDVFGDYAFGSPAHKSNGQVRVFSGLLGNLLYTWSGTAAGNRFGHFMAHGGDINNDKHQDVIVAAYLGDYVRAFSGKDGKVIWTCTGGVSKNHGWTCGGNSDVDNDGYSDIIAGPGGGTAPGHTIIYSGKTGKAIKTLNGYQVAGGGDVDGDGHGDVLTGTWLLNGIAWMYSGKALTLRTTQHVIKRAPGGNQALNITAGTAQGGQNYWIFGSLGSKPGITLGGLKIPLNYDPYTDLTILFANTGPFDKFRGKLDANGNATATFKVPANTVPATISVQHAAIIYDTNGNFRMVTNATPTHFE